LEFHGDDDLNVIGVMSGLNILDGQKNKFTGRTGQGHEG
jgi:hypothetical protein